MPRYSSIKRRRVLYLVWHVRKGIRVEECVSYLKEMGLDERGLPLPEQKQ